MIFPPLRETSSRYATATAGTGERGQPDGQAVTRPYLDGHVTTAELGREVLRLVEQDVSDGCVPWDVYDFTELHNFADANVYTLTVCGYDGSDAGNDLTNEVQDWVASALRGGRPCSLTYDAQWHERRQFNHREWPPARWLDHVAAQNEATPSPAAGTFLSDSDEAFRVLCGAIARTSPGNTPLRRIEQIAAELAQSRRAAYVALSVSCGSEPAARLDAVVAQLLQGSE